jgi:hypothetical protein
MLYHQSSKDLQTGMLYYLRDNVAKMYIGKELNVNNLYGYVLAPVQACDGILTDEEIQAGCIKRMAENVILNVPYKDIQISGEVSKLYCSIVCQLMVPEQVHQWINTYSEDVCIVQEITGVRVEDKRLEEGYCYKTGGGLYYCYLGRTRQGRWLWLNLDKLHYLVTSDNVHYLFDTSRCFNNPQGNKVLEVTAGCKHCKLDRASIYKDKKIIFPPKVQYIIQSTKERM